MIEPVNHRWARGGLTLVIAALLALVVLAPSNSLACSQRRTARRTATNHRPNIYDRSYLQGYDEGYVQGQTDWRGGASRNFQRADQDQTRRRPTEQSRNSSGESRQGYQLGFELGYSDGYLGRTRNMVIPANAPALSRSATAADAKQGSDPQAVDDAWKRYPDSTRPNRYRPPSVSDNTKMRLRLTAPINTKKSL
jgi:hypothetical protein